MLEINYIKNTTLYGMLIEFNPTKDHDKWMRIE